MIIIKINIITIVITKVSLVIETSFALFIPYLLV